MTNQNEVSEHGKNQAGDEPVLRPKRKSAKVGDKKKALPIVEVKSALLDWYDLRLNEITGVIESKFKKEKIFTALNENDIYIRLLSNGYRISFSNLCALLNSDFIPKYNPFKEYFASLPAHKEYSPDYIGQLANHIKAIEQAQFNHHFRKMLVRTIACAIDDKVFNKHAFILVGAEQNSGKSTFCRYLCPPTLKEYYSESIPNDKDGMISLCENFMINLDELSTLSKFEVNHLKSLFSKDSVRVRHPYARKSQTDPRRVSFVGSTNEDSFLSDTTGSVRWLCFEINGIDWDYTKINIDMVWAQANSLYRSGFKFQLTSDEINANEKRNEQFQQLSMEIEYIQLYLLPGTVLEHNEFWTTTEIRHHIIEKSDRKADLKSIDKLGKALKKLGFKREVKRVGESMQPTRGYYIKYHDKL